MPSFAPTRSKSASIPTRPCASLSNGSIRRQPRRTHTVAAEVPEEEREFQERQRQAARLAVAAIAVLVIVIVGAVFAYRARAARSRAQEQRQTTQEPAVVAPPQPAPAAAEQPAARADTGRPSAPPPAPDKDKDKNKAPAVPGQLRLEIRPTSACWVSVTADGKKLFARVMTAGQLETVVIAREATSKSATPGHSRIRSTTSRASRSATGGR